MVIEKTKAFNSKILLFGEYALMKGSMALSIPFDKYIGQLLFDQASTNSQSKHYSVTYLLDYYKYLNQFGFGKQINLIDFKNDIEHGLIFETNIPISYGLGSSGAIVASIYNAYAFGKLENPIELKSVFSKMESYYHGKSSGLDPLVSYLNSAVLISKNGELKTVELPGRNSKSNSGIFLLDTKSVGETQPLVNWFLGKYEEDKFKSIIQNKLIPANSNCISNYLSGDFKSLLGEVKAISQFTFDNLKPMIPNSLEDVWKDGLETDNFYLKLCGSGGGGMMLGFAENLAHALKKLSGFETSILMKF
jgi:mevalonate kinase